MNTPNLKFLASAVSLDTRVITDKVTDRSTDITTGLNIASVAYIGGRRHNSSLRKRRSLRLKPKPVDVSVATMNINNNTKFVKRRVAVASEANLSWSERHTGALTRCAEAVRRETSHYSEGSLVRKFRVMLGLGLGVKGYLYYIIFYYTFSPSQDTPVPKILSGLYAGHKLTVSGGPSSRTAT